MTNHTLTSTLTECREALGRMAHGKAILSRSVLSAVREALIARGLVHPHIDGYLTPTTRAAAYTAAPNTFEL